MTSDPITTQTIPVWDARHFRATDGVAEGDEFSFADELVMDDVYELQKGAERQPLTLRIGSEKLFEVANGSAVGHAGNTVVLDSCVTVIAPDSTTTELLVLVEVENDGVEAIYILPLTSLDTGVSYRLVGASRDVATSRLADVACVSFTRGTHITMASGMQVRIEDLKVGDKVLTRDDGPQPIRWVGQTTVRALGEFAPVVIKKDALHNENDLIVSPNHRLFVYQRQDRIGAGRNEVLVKVRHLIDGETVYQHDGGYVDYFQLLFDDHQIIYAEGIAAESLFIDPLTTTAIQRDAKGIKQHGRRAHLDYEIQETLLSQPGAVKLLRKASSS